MTSGHLNTMSNASAGEARFRFTTAMWKPAQTVKNQSFSVWNAA